MSDSLFREQPAKSSRLHGLNVCPQHCHDPNQHLRVLGSSLRSLAVTDYTGLFLDLRWFGCRSQCWLVSYPLVDAVCAYAKSRICFSVTIRLCLTLTGLFPST